MALDTTVGGATADSYLSVTDADARAGADLGPNADLWLNSGISTEQKEKALRRATREIDGYLRSGWARYEGDQALLFPRAIDYTGTPAAAFIASNVRWATYEQASWLLANRVLMDRAGSRRAATSGSQDDEKQTAVLSAEALMYLEGYRRAGGSRAIRSVRMSSGFAW